MDPGKNGRGIQRCDKLPQEPSAQPVGEPRASGTEEALDGYAGLLGTFYQVEPPDSGYYRSTAWPGLILCGDWKTSPDPSRGLSVAL